MQKTKIKRGISAKAAIIPAIIVIAVMHVVIIVCTIVINDNSNKMSTTMQNYSSYISEATKLQGGSSLLSETSNTFVMTGNADSLIVYARELSNPRRGRDIASYFENVNVGDEVKTNVFAAAENAENMFNVQVRAIGLITSFTALPANPFFAAIPDYTLTEDERSMTNEQRAELAKELLYSADYNVCKQNVSTHSSASVAALQTESGAISADLMRTIVITRYTLDSDRPYHTYTIRNVYRYNYDARKPDYGFCPPYRKRRTS